MAKFEVTKNGYNTVDVDKFLNNLTLKYEEKLGEQKDRLFALKNENRVLTERLAGYEDKDKQISKALLFAVEKAEQIEDSAKKIYDLEIKRIKLVYEQWNRLLKVMEAENPSLFKNGDFSTKLKEFKDGVNTIVLKNAEITANVKEDLKKNSDNYIKNLLNRMDYVVHKDDEEKKINKELKIEHSRENNRLSAIGDKLSRLTTKKEVSLADEYLNNDDDKSFDAYSKNIARTEYTKSQNVGESGFDLNKALNPDEDLDEIMKSFKIDED